VTVANAHAIFNGLKSKPSYLAAITVDPEDRKALLNARGLIRSTLKAAFASIVHEEEYWELAYRSNVQKSNRKVVVVKFMMQGSFAYKTLNAPAIQGQEIDLDDGMYVPVDFLQNGRPALVAKTLFMFVEKALAPLCKAQGWRLAEKPTCVRVIVGRASHIDIPIYSIPRAQFEELVEKSLVADALSNRMVAASAMTRIPTDKVMLAMRDGDWVHSDPKALEDWVDERIEVYGEVYRRLCRFFKGWRDVTWLKSELSSICLMHVIDIALERLNLEPVEHRDDEMILEVAKILPVILREEVCNPVIKGSCLNDWSPEVRAEIVKEAELLATRMVKALERSSTGSAVIVELIGGFGTRIPDAPDAIKFPESRIEVIRSAPAAKVAAPKIVSTTSG